MNKDIKSCKIKGQKVYKWSPIGVLSEDESGNKRLTVIPDLDEDMEMTQEDILNAKNKL